MQCVPFELTSLDAYPTRSSWDAVATEIVGTMLDRWRLSAGEPYVGGEAGAVLRVEREDGSPAVLKVGFPHPEAEWEAVALDAWAPQLAPRVLRQDPWTWSMLLERVESGIPLARAPLPAKDAIAVGAELHARLRDSQIPEGVPSLASVLHAYAHDARARFAEQTAAYESLGVGGLVTTGIDALAELADSPSDRVLLHGDLNPGNILRSGDQWLAIDPKPMHGDPAFDLWPLLAQLGSPWTRPDPSAYLHENLDHLAVLTSYDAERMARWAYARTALTVSWHLSDGDERAARSAARELRAWTSVSGA